MVDIQRKIKELFILTKMPPLDQKKIFPKEIFNAKINIKLKIVEYDLPKGVIAYELKKFKKNMQSSKQVDCKIKMILIISFSK